MIIFIVLVFVIGYIFITLGDNLKIDKLIPALLMMAFSWAGVYLGMDIFTQWFNSSSKEMMDITAMVGADRLHLFKEALFYHFEETCEILIFLIGAMSIVEIIEHFHGFSTIKGYVKTHNKRTLLWIIAILAFILSSIIDNMTSTIVLITILRKILDKREDRIWYAGLIIIAANAGGAWSPIGDVTTTMLWIGDKVTTPKLMEYLFLPSVISFILPTIMASFMKPFRGTFELTKEKHVNSRSSLMMYLGLVMIISVPIYKATMNFPPYLGMMFALAVVALAGEIISKRQFHLLPMFVGSEEEEKKQKKEYHSPLHEALSRIEMPSVLFFLGILMTVGALESIGVVFVFGQSVSHSLGEEPFIILLGLASSVIDNVPLVAASMGMFSEGTDALVWHFIALAAGTGGSILIIGSAAGVIAMGMEKINFFWYVKKISWLAILGFFGGVGWYIIERLLMGSGIV